MKKNAIFIAVIGLLMISSGGIMSFVTSFAKDVTDAKDNVEIIQNKFQSFKELMEVFNGERELVYSDVINDLYVEHASEKYSSWITTFQSYEQTIAKVSEYRPILEQRCIDILYNDSNIQSKCDSMLLSYETAINYYVKDVFKFNEFIEVYNAGVDELSRLAPYALKGYNYIDFNDDGKYLGK